MRKDHSLVQETNLEEVLQNIKKKKFPTLYHKQLTQKYSQYEIEEKHLKTSYKQTKNYLTGLIINTHITEKIPQQIQDEQKKDPTKGITSKKFNTYAQHPSYWWQWNKLNDFPPLFRNQFYN